MSTRNYKKPKEHSKFIDIIFISFFLLIIFGSFFLYVSETNGTTDYLDFLHNDKNIENKQDDKKYTS
jgi:hypothetical protein